LQLPIHIIVSESGGATEVGPSIEDPFEPARNLGMSATSSGLLRLREELSGESRSFLVLALLLQLLIQGLGACSLSHTVRLLVIEPCHGGCELVTCGAACGFDGLQLRLQLVHLGRHGFNLCEPEGVCPHTPTGTSVTESDLQPQLPWGKQYWKC